MNNEHKCSYFFRKYEKNILMVKVLECEQDCKFKQGVMTQPDRDVSQIYEIQ